MTGQKEVVLVVGVANENEVVRDLSREEEKRKTWMSFWAKRAILDKVSDGKKRKTKTKRKSETNDANKKKEVQS